METATQRTATQAMGAIPRYAAGGPMRLKKPAKPGAASVMAAGGSIKGKGTGTSDEVPIMASNGEYMIRAAAVEEVGKEVLDAINKLGDDNEPDEAMEAKDGKPAMKKGGAVRCMAGGGIIDKFGNNVPNTPEQQAQLANQSAMYVAGAQAANPQPDAAMAAHNAALASAQTLAANKLVKAGSSLPAAATMTKAPQAPSRPIGAMARSAADTLAPNTMDSVSNTVNGASGEFAKGQYAAGAGQLARGGIGAGIAMMQDAMTPAFAVANTVGNAVGEFGRGFMRQPAAAPGAPAAPVTPQAAMATPPAYNPAADSQRANVQAPQRPGAPNPASGSPDEVMPNGNVNVTKQANGVMSFSGQNITGQPQYTGSAANTMNSGVITAQNQGAMDGIQARQDARDQGARNKMQYDAEVAGAKAVNEAGRRMNLEYDLKNGNRNERLAAQAILGSMDATEKDVRGNALAMRGQDQAASALRQNQQLATAKDGREATASAMDQKAKQQLMDAQQEYLNAGDDPVKQKAAERKLITLGGKQPNDKGQVITLPDTLGDQGQVIRGGQAVLMPDGTLVRPEQGQAKTGGVQAPTTKAEYDKLPKGAKYTHPDGTTRTKG